MVRVSATLFAVLTLLGWGLAARAQREATHLGAQLAAQEHQALSCAVRQGEREREIAAAYARVRAGER